VHCFAGCSVDDVLSAVGLEIEALFPPRPAVHASPERKPWRVREVVAALEFELSLALVYLAAIHAGRPIADRARAGECRARITRFIEELRRAS
jgi:hypothetical protein